MFIMLATVTNTKACVMSVPTKSGDLSLYKNIIAIANKEPEPTEVSPTIKPNVMPIKIVRLFFVL